MEIVDTTDNARDVAPEAYRAGRGLMVHDHAEVALTTPLFARYRGKVQLIFTSPPFPLNRKKQYGNHQGEAYIKWLSGFAVLFR